jgi:hypothetical protein
VTLLQVAAAKSSQAFTEVTKEEEGVTLFCYAFVRTPHERVLPAFTKQLTAACDGWEVFSHRDDSRFGVLNLYTQKQEKIAMRSHQKGMLLRAYKHFNETGIINHYDWFLKVEPDTFLVPSRLKTAISRFAKDFGKPVTQGVDVDGFFMAATRSLLTRTMDAFVRHPGCTKQFEEISGVLLEWPSYCPNLQEGGYAMLADADGDALVASYEECRELRHVQQRKAFSGSPKQRLCSRFSNTLLRCFEYGSSIACPKEKVLKGVCGRSLPKGVCVSSHFAALHPVKELDDYLSLAISFP